MIKLEPETLDQVRSATGARKFATFLAGNGATILDPTNPWETIRYKLDGCGTLVIYRKANGWLTIPTETREHLRCFELGRAIERIERPKKRNNAELKEFLAKRDGDKCCICGKGLDRDKTTEHWVPIKNGGTNDPANLGLAHKKCNEAVGDMCVTEKVRYAVKVQSVLEEEEE